jgi:16S rRNA (adenine1518-N6/adenine1519-N6)-dimethyltransferase
MRFKHGLGQNFLYDEEALETMVDSGDLKKTDTVVEIGPGTGFLTEKLLKKVKQVKAVEFDRDMISFLKAGFLDTPNLELIEGDALKFDPKAAGLKPYGYKVVANIPYYITSPLIKRFLQSEVPPSLMVILVQKEVAEKVCGSSGKSMITIETQLFGEPEMVAIVKSSAFYPRPQVDSAVLKIKVLKKPLLPANQMRDFLRMVGFGFTMKRKVISNSLGAGFHMKPSEMRIILEKAGIDPNVRPESLEIEDWKKLAKTLPKIKK